MDYNFNLLLICIYPWSKSLVNKQNYIVKNLRFIDERKRLEALAIKIYNPLLNKQVDRKAVSFIWNPTRQFVYQNGLQLSR
jgi:hypothetical protein